MKHTPNRTLRTMLAVWTFLLFFKRGQYAQFCMQEGQFRDISGLAFCTGMLLFDQLLLLVPLELGAGVGTGVGMQDGGCSWDLQAECWGQRRREGAGSRVGPGIAYWVQFVVGSRDRAGPSPVSQFYCQFTYAITNNQPKIKSAFLSFRSNIPTEKQFNFCSRCFISFTCNIPQTQNNISMGQVASCCSNDMFDQLRRKYGEKFTKLMIAEKCKDFIYEHFKGLTGKFNEVFSQIKNKIMGVVSGRKDEVHQIYQNVKLEANNKLPGGISMIETVKGQPIDQASGYNDLQRKIDGVQTQAFSKLDSEKEVVLNQMNSKKNEMVQRIDKERPEIQYYDSLPTPIQTMLRSKAEEVLKDELTKNKGDIAKEIQSQFNPENAMELFGKVNPDGQLSGITGQAANLIMNALGLGSGGAGGLIQNGLNFFTG